MRLTVSIFDHDRHTKITEIANAKIPLKDVKLLIISDEPIKMSVDLNDVKQVRSIAGFPKLFRYKATYKSLFPNSIKIQLSKFCRKLYFLFMSY